MANTLQFVDKIDAAPTLRLDLNDGTTWGLDHKDFSPPDLKRSVVDTMLRDGAKVCASAYENRVVTLTLVVKAATKDLLATELQKLDRELNRAQNILKWQAQGQTNPVFFRTWRSPGYRFEDTLEVQNMYRLKLNILAEPFAYGNMVEQTGMVYNDPAAGSNGLYFTIAGGDGDVPTPLFVRFEPNVSEQRAVLLAVRRHGAPSLFVKQCEAMIMGTNTSVVADATFSGGSKARTTPGMTGWSTRLTWNPCPGAGASLNWRGIYRVFVRVTVALFTEPAIWGIRTVYGPDSPYSYLIYGDEVVLDEAAGPQNSLLDLGLIPIPNSTDPIYDGYGGALPVEPSILRFQARRTLGTSSLDWDYAVLVPADEELCIASSFATSVLDGIFDGPNDIVYLGDGSQVWNRNPIPVVGSIPLVTPNQVNLYVVLRGIRPSPQNFLNYITDTMGYTARYWSRWLYVRP